MRRIQRARMRVMALLLFLGALRFAFTLPHLSFRMGGGGGRPYPQALMGGEQTWNSQPDDYQVTITSASTVTVPDTGYKLVAVSSVTGTTPGDLGVTYDGQSVAHFPAPSNATSGQMKWAVSWAIKGQTLASTIFAFNGGLSSATLYFSKDGGSGVPIAAYRSISFTVTTSATHSAFTAFTAVNYDVGPAIPRAAIAFGTVKGYVFLWPTVGTGQGGVVAPFVQGTVELGMAPAIPKATSLTPGYTNSTAAGTLTIWVLYDPQ